jgi:hypothetical protein
MTEMYSSHASGKTCDVPFCEKGQGAVRKREKRKRRKRDKREEEKKRERREGDKKRE